MPILTAQQLNEIAKGVGYTPTGGSFSSVGLQPSYQYVDKSGALQTTQANSAQDALKSPNIGSSSGVITPPIVPTTISSSSIQTGSTPQLPGATTDTTNHNATTTGAKVYTTPSGALDEKGNVISTPADQKTTPVTDQAKTALQRIQELLGMTTGKEAYSQDQLALSGALDLEKKQKQLSSRAASLSAESQALKNEAMAGGAIENRLQVGAEGRGITAGGLAPIQAGELRKNQIQQANIASQALTVQAEYALNQGDLETARLTAQRAVDLKYKDIETEIDQKTKLINIMKPFMDAEEQKQADAVKATNDASKNDLADKKKSQIDAINYAQTNLDSATAAAILRLDPNSPTFNTDLANLTAGVKMKNENGTAVNVPAGGGGTLLSGLTPEQQADPFIKLLASTAGGKALTDTSIQKLDKGITVLGQLGVLQSNIANVSTGPIIGAFKGANPWDTNAQTIKAQLNAIVPNLARGIYGEVGVLTDNDIRQYSKTLPNLTSTADVRNAVLGITLDLIGKNIKNALEVNAAAGRDVSGFIDLYTNMVANRDSILSQIPGYKGSSAPSLVQLGITSDEQSLFQSTVGISGSTSQTTSGGFFSNLWKGLTGQ